MFNFLSRLFAPTQRRFALSRRRPHERTPGGLLGNPVVRIALGGLLTYAARRFAQRRRYASGSAL